MVSPAAMYAAAMKAGDCRTNAVGTRPCDRKPKCRFANEPEPALFAMALLILSLILAACGGGGDTGPTTTAPAALTTLPPATSSPPPTTTTSTAPETTTTTTTTSPPVNAAPAFALTQVVFGRAASVTITNWGNALGSLDGYWLRQGELTVALPTTELGPGEQAVIGLGEAPPTEHAGIASVEHLGPVIGTLEVTSGEIGFAGDESFSPESLVAYVSWGEGEHPTLDQAMAASLWTDTSVETDPDAPSISTGVFPATSSLDWFTDIGG
jgi:hypothetical protein